MLNEREWGSALPLANKQLLFCASLIPAAWVGLVDLHVNTHYQVNLAASLLAEKPIIIDLPASPQARNRQKHPASLSSARNTSSKRHLDDTVPWHTLGICPSLWTVNESATDDISHYEKPVMAPLHCSSVSTPPDTSQVMMETLQSVSSWQTGGRSCCLSWADKWHINTVFA